MAYGLENKIPFEKWIQSEMKTLEAFVKYWTKSNNENPEYFPLDLSEGEWDEQYRIWLAETP